MTPGARVQAAVEILDRIEQGEPAEKALTNWSRRSRLAGSKDRRAIRDHVFGALRTLRSSQAIGGGKSGRATMIGYLLQGGKDVEELFSGERHAPNTLSEVERDKFGQTIDVNPAGDQQQDPQPGPARLRKRTERDHETEGCDENCEHVHS